MNRHDFLKNSVLAGCGVLTAPSLIQAAGKAFSIVSKNNYSLLGNRFASICFMVRTTPWEVSRDVKLLLKDESSIHTLEVAKTMREAFAENNATGRLTWGFTLNALEDKRQNYIDIRKYAAECHYKYGDEVSYFPGYFPALYLPRQRVNKEITEALQRITDFVGNGYKPQSIFGGFLSAENMRYLSEVEKIHVAHGNIWSQHAVDAGGADGSPSYPYYPSKEHICKPAQSKTDFIDCVNLDGWSVDFLCARYSGGIAGTNLYNGASSRRGVGPIETYCELGLDIGQLSVIHTQSLHYDRGFELNGFGWVPCVWELQLLKAPERGVTAGDTFIPTALKKWVGEAKKRWTDLKFVPFGEFGEIWRSLYTDNNKWNYRFEEKGLGIGNSFGNKEIHWFMNKSFRLALVRNWHKNRPYKVIDFTRYDLSAHEPKDPSPEHPITDWSLINRINQKELRPEDKPVLITQLTNDEQALIAKYYPDLF